METRNTSGLTIHPLQAGEVERWVGIAARIIEIVAMEVMGEA
jgi:hypothetical protein